MSFITNFNQKFNHPDGAKLLMRLVFGILMLFHGVFKLQNGVDWISGMLQAQGLPGFIAYGAYIGEVIAPIFILLGLFTRPAALIYTFNMIVAVLLVNSAKFFTLSNVGAWGLEVDAMYFFAGIIIFLQGAGKYALQAENK